MAQSITAFEAKNRLGRLLDRVQSGERITITRHGEPVAMLVPIVDHSGEEVTAALETFRQVRQSLKDEGLTISRDEIRRWVEEGRR